MSDSPSVQQLEVANAQRKQAQFATREMLFAKPARTERFTIQLDPSAEPVAFELVALPGPAYDDLVAACPPTEKQKGEGLQINPDKFVPSLLHHVVRRPQVSIDDWVKLAKSDEWSAGEIGTLYGAANALCRRELDLTPFD